MLKRKFENVGIRKKFEDNWEMLSPILMKF